MSGVTEQHISQKSILHLVYSPFWILLGNWTAQIAEVVCLGSLELKHCLYWISVSVLVEGRHSALHCCITFCFVEGTCVSQHTGQKFCWQFCRGPSIPPVFLWHHFSFWVSVWLRQFLYSNGVSFLQVPRSSQLFCSSGSFSDSGSSPPSGLFFSNSEAGTFPGRRIILSIATVPLWRLNPRNFPFWSGQAISLRKTGYLILSLGFGRLSSKNTSMMDVI